MKSQRKVKRDALEEERYFQERERGAVVRRVESKVSRQLKLGNGELRAKLEDQSKPLGKLGQRGSKEFEKALPPLPHLRLDIQTVSLNGPRKKSKILHGK